MITLIQPEVMILSALFIPFVSMIMLMLFCAVKNATDTTIEITDEELWASIRISSPESVRGENE